MYVSIAEATIERCSEVERRLNIMFALDPSHRYRDNLNSVSSLSRAFFISPKDSDHYKQ